MAEQADTPPLSAPSRESNRLSAFEVEVSARQSRRAAHKRRHHSGGSATGRSSRPARRSARPAPGDEPRSPPKRARLTQHSLDAACTERLSLDASEECVAFCTRSRCLSEARSTLLPLEGRDFACSPFSTSTAVESDCSVYTPTRTRSRVVKKQRRSKIEEPAEEKGEVRRSLIPRPQNACRYSLRSKSATDTNPRDNSASSTASDSSQHLLSRPRNSSVADTSKPSSSTPPKRDTTASKGQDKHTKTRSRSRNVTIPQPTSPQRPSSSKRLSLSSNLGVWFSKKNSTSARVPLSKRQSVRRSTGQQPTGVTGWGVDPPLRRNTRSHDMPQQNAANTPANNAPSKRDKKGKGALGSCASSSGGAASGGTSANSQGGAGGRRAAQAAEQNTVASTSSTSQITALNMTGGQGTDNKTKGKGAAHSNKQSSAGVASDDCTPASATGGGPDTTTVPAGESSSDDGGEVVRLQALLEARGLPPHLLGALGPRMQHLLHRTMGASSTASKAAQLLSGLQATGDEGQQLQAVIEMCQLLVMGNEDTLAGFPVRQVVPALINLLGMDHNFDMMNHACRALTYMMEALPRASGAVSLAVPAFLSHLQAITCMDVAEQSLTALDMLSRRHSKTILHSRGVAACLMYLDFFSINAQRAALSVTSNCCQNLTAEEFHFVRDSLQLLANRLTQQDKKSVESVCLAFSRLVDSYQHDPARLQEIASPELLTSLQQLLVVSPPLISTGTFITVLRMLGVMCSACPSLAVALHSRNIADTLLYLLTGSTTPATPTNLNSSLQDEIELIPRSPQELYEITSLIAELMPRLPIDGIFAVDAYLDRPWGSGVQPEPPVQWQWRDDRGIWRAYSASDCRALEQAHASAEDEVTLSARARSYTVDLHSMQQVNDDTGTARPVQRRLQPQPQPTSNQQEQDDPRAAWIHVSGLPPSSGGAPSAFVRQLVGVLGEVYTGSAGPAVRCQCLKAMLRIIYHSDAELLRAVLKNQVISSQIAGMLASADLRVCCGALQLADILLCKLPDVFAVQFRREGVVHQARLLAEAPPVSPLTTGPSPGAVPQQRRDTALFGLRVKDKMLSTSRSCFPVTVPYQQQSKSGTALSLTACPSTSTAVEAARSAPVVQHYPSYQQHQQMAIAFSGNSASFNNSSTISVESILSAASNGSNATTLDGAESIHSASLQQDYIIDNRSASPVCMRLTDVLKQARKRAPKRTGGAGTGGVTTLTTTGSVQARYSSRSSAAATRHSDEGATQHGGSSRSRLGGATSKTTSFLSAFNPARWGRQQSVSSPTAAPDSSTANSGATLRDSAASLLAKTHSTANLAAQNREKARQWVREQAVRFLSLYSSPRSGAGGNSLGAAGAGGAASAAAHPALEHLSQLGAQLRDAAATSSTASANAEQPVAQRALHCLRDMLADSDISPFEVNHSGLIGALLHYLTYVSGTSEPTGAVTAVEGSVVSGGDEPSPDALAAREHRLRLFLNVFADMPISSESTEPLYTFSFGALQALVGKVNACISQLEQFPVRVHDLPARPATSALKFFNTHQLKCNLQRHPTCTNLKQWKGGTVKIDPLALVQAIERYLVVRGYARLRDGKEGTGISGGSVASSGIGGGPGPARTLGQDSDDDNSDDEIDDSLATVVISHTTMKHKLQFLIGESVLPYNMTVYQAVRQFSPAASDLTDLDPDGDTPLGNASIWVQTHTIYYRSLGSEPAASSITALGTPTISGRKGKGTSTKSNSRRKTDDLWNDGIIPPAQSPLVPFLVPRLSLDECSSHTMSMSGASSDASLPALCLQRVLHALSRHWPALYPAACGAPRSLLPQSAFVNSKLAAKASRQLQDPLVIMTGNLPQWLQQIAYACPFVLPLDARHVLLYAVSFERERAWARAAEGAATAAGTASGGGSGAGGGGAGAGSVPTYAESERAAAPRLDRRKRTVARHHLLRQAENVMHEFAHSKALLEVQYENEVGTGLGPTLEFYALVSQELQRADLDLWHGSENFRQKPSSFGGDIVKNNQQPAVMAESDHLQTAIEIHAVNLADDQNRNTNEGIFESFDMPMIVDAADINLNQNETRNSKLLNVTETVATGVGEVTYVSWPCGLFPQALGRSTKASQLSRVKAKFRFLGKFMAKAVMDSRMLDLPFSVTLYRWVIGEERCMSLADIRHVAPDLWRSLQRLQRVAATATAIQHDPTLSTDTKKNMIDSLELDGCPIEELGLDFILPGHGCTELRRGGRDTPVTGHNLQQYIALVTHWMLYEGVVRQMSAFREGFESVFPISNLRMFYPEELEQVFCGSAGGRWDARTLAECCRPDHGYTPESRTIRNLYEILSSYDRDEQRMFVQFVTGSPRLPTGGFKALTPPLTVVRKTVESNVNPDDYLPSVMTCVNYLKLPDYSSIEIMRHKLRVAASEGQHSFHLS